MFTLAAAIGFALHLCVTYMELRYHVIMYECISIHTHGTWLKNNSVMIVLAKHLHTYILSILWTTSPTRTKPAYIHTVHTLDNKLAMGAQGSDDDF